MRSNKRQILSILLSVLLACMHPSLLAQAPPELLLPKARILPQELGVIVNDEDPLSVRIAEYYRQARGIPEENLIHVRIPTGRKQIGDREFAAIQIRVRAQTPDHVQAYALTWVEPYRVKCMSITTAFAHGEFDEKWCSERGSKCTPTASGEYYNSPSVMPWQDHGIRPTLSIAALNFEQAKALIDRGIASDGTWPTGTAYLLDTSDKARTIRAALFPRIRDVFDEHLQIEILQQDHLYDRDDVLFYFTGQKRVEGLDTLGFLPGAIADHLTSGAGQLTAGWQMSALRWLEAGATGSFGAVKEPCNFLGKFPNPGILMAYYLQGATLLEAYWKSVAMPGEGIFIGEPLAAPYSGYRLLDAGDHWLLESAQLGAGHYRLLSAPSRIGPYRAEDFTLRASAGQQRFRLPKLDRLVYRLQPIAEE
ncbi:TIGR03790 family protein [Thiohalobacter thiocyanaticus]|nr:TIGR03790 family protein [Thiohalobacter thiocyanaticus]